MTNKQAEKRVRKAFSAAVPDTFEQILEKCHAENKDQKIIKMPKRTNYFLKRIVSVAAMVAIILTAGFAGYGIANLDSVYSIISFDVNPSIEIEINKNEKIIDAIARNEDGKKILGEMDLKGSDLSVAVNAIIGSMVRNDYLDELSNSILISVDSNNAKKSAELEKKLMEEIKMLLSNESFDAAVLSQTIKTTKEIKKLAEEYGITAGKAQLIKKIIDADSKYSFKDLAPLTINELNLIVSGEKINIKTNGSASEKRYIGKSKAKKIALKDDGVSSDEISGYKCKLKYKSGKMVYEISFKTEKANYDYIINATSGKIIKAEIERKASDDDTTSSTPQNVVTVGEDTAKTTALSLAGVLEINITEYACVLNDTVEEPYYSISFFVGETAYSYNINATTGELMTVSTEAPEDGTSSSQTSSDVTSSQITESDVTSSTPETSSVAQNP